VSLLAKQNKKPEFWDFLKESKVYERWMSVKQRILLHKEEKRKKKVEMTAKKKMELLEH
jgi:hypothetical protein